MVLTRSQRRKKVSSPAASEASDSPAASGNMLAKVSAFVNKMIQSESHTVLACVVSYVIVFGLGLIVWEEGGEPEVAAFVISTVGIDITSTLAHALFDNNDSGMFFTEGSANLAQLSCYLMIAQLSSPPIVATAAVMTAVSLFMQIKFINKDMPALRMFVYVPLAMAFLYTVGMQRELLDARVGTFFAMVITSAVLDMTDYPDSKIADVTMCEALVLITRVWGVYFLVSALVLQQKPRESDLLKWEEAVREFAAVYLGL